MKKLLKGISALLAAIMVLPSISACDKKGETMKNNQYKLEFMTSESGYYVNVSKGKTTWGNKDTGAFGVRVSYDDINDVSDIQYAYYDEFHEIDGGYIATASINSEDGSVFKTEDAFSVREDGVSVVRNFKVEKTGDGKGFMTYFPIRDSRVGDVVERKWFAPGSYYGNKEANFNGTGVKFGFTEDAVCNVDNLSAPTVGNYVDGTMFSITDRTRGYRETNILDTTNNENYILVDEVFNIPGIGLRDINFETSDEHVEMYFCYPSHTHNYINIHPFTNNYRMLPVEKSLSREVAFDIRIDEKETFEEAVDYCWEKVYDEYSVIDSRYAPVDVYKALCDNIYRSYGILNSVPQYMTNSDHPYSESGFLYRNCDLAYLMIEAGYRLDKPEYIEQADNVINYHIEKDLIVDNIIYPFERSETEGVMAVLNAYKTHLEHNIDNSDWLAYVLQKARQKRDKGNPMAIPLMMEVAKYTKDNSYIERAAEILKEYEKFHNDYFYDGAIMNPAGDLITNRESAMIYVGIYLNMYELTGNAEYLSKAKQAEVYFESNMMLQNIDMVPKGATGYETLPNNRFREIGTIGNETFKPYGISWVSGQTASADNASIYAYPDLIKLYEITGEERYKNIADYVLYNGTLSVNMGDKNWLMDDIRFSSGRGFQNEYFGISSSTDPVSAGRGTMHMSNLGWNMFVVLNSLNYMAETDEEFMNKKANAFDTAVLKNSTASSELNSLYRSYNAFDKDEKTMWRPASDDTEKTLTVSLGEFVAVDKVIVDLVKTESATVSISKDGVKYDAVSEISNGEVVVDDICNYVRISLKGANDGAGVSGVKVIGHPVVVKNYAIDAKTTISGVQNDAISDWNYSTKYVSSKSSETYLVDLGKVRAITEVSMLFDVNVDFRGQDFIGKKNFKDYSYIIEYSNTAEEGSWKVYADRSDDPRMLAIYKETKFVRARYFRIKANVNKGNIAMTELKVCGV